MKNWDICSAAIRKIIPKARHWICRCPRRRSRASKTAGERTARSGPGRAVIRKRARPRRSWSSSSPAARSTRTGITSPSELSIGEIGVRQYWVIDRFRRTLTVYTFSGESDQVQIILENQNYESALLPGFELPLGRLLKLADRWAKKRP